MRKVAPVVLLRVLIISLIQLVCVGVWALFFLTLTEANSDSDGAILYIFVMLFLIGIMALHFPLSNYICERKKDFTSCFYGTKISENNVYSIVNQTYSKMKSIIVVAHLAAIVLFNFVCGLLKSDSGAIALILTFSTNVFRWIFRITGTVCFIISMFRYCGADFKATVTVCPKCGRVTGYYAHITQTIVESWKETNYKTSSYTTREKVGEVYDSDGNSCDVYGDVEHISDDSYDVYHPGLYEYEYQCVLCGYKYKKRESH